MSNTITARLPIKNSSGATITTNLVTIGSYSFEYRFIFEAPPFIKKTSISSLNLSFYVSGYQQYSQVQIKYNNVFYNPTSILDEDSGLKKVTFSLFVILADTYGTDFSELIIFGGSIYNFSIVNGPSTSNYLPQITVVYDDFLSFPKSDAKEEYQIGNNFFSFNFSYASGLGIFRKRLFEGIIPYKITFSFDPINLNFFDSLVPSLDLNKHILCDSKGHTYFSSVFGGSSRFYDKEGSGLILEQDECFNPNATYWKIYHPLKAHERMIFDENGKLVAFFDEKNREVDVSYYSNYVTYTDFNNNVIKIEYCLIQNQISCNLKFNNVLFYSFEESISNNLRSLLFYEINGPSVWFMFNNNKHISAAYCDGLRLELTYNAALRKTTNIAEKSGSSGGSYKKNKSYSFTPDSISSTVITTDYKGITYKFYLDENYRIVKTVEIKNSQEISVVTLDDSLVASMSSWLSDSTINTLNIVNSDFRNQVGLVTSDSNPYGNTQEIEMLRFNMGMSINNNTGDNYLVRLYLSAPDSYIGSQTSLVYADVRFVHQHNSVNLEYTTTICFMRTRQGCYAEFILESIDDFDVFKNLFVTLHVDNAVGTFYISNFFVRKIDQYNIFYYLNKNNQLDNTNLHLLNKTRFHIRYRPFQTGPFLEITNALFTKEDLKINQMLTSKGVPYIFYNGLRDCVYNNFYKVWYCFDDDGDISIDIDKFIFVTKNVNYADVEYIYFYSSYDIELESNIISSFVDSSMGNHKKIYSVDYENKIMSKSTLNGKTIKYEYDGNTYIKEQLYQYSVLIGRITNKFDSFGRLIKISDDFGGVVGDTTYAYNGNTYALSSESISKNNNSSTSEYYYNSNSTYNYVERIENDYCYNEINYFGSYLGSVLSSNGTEFIYSYDSFKFINYIYFANSSYVLLSINNTISNDTDTSTYEYTNGYSYTIVADKYGRVTYCYEEDVPKVKYTYATIEYDYNNQREYDFSNLSSISILRYVFDKYINQITRNDYDDNNRICRICAFSCSNNIESPSFNNLIVAKDIVYDEKGQIENVHLVSSSSYIEADYEEEFGYDSNNEITECAATHTISNTDFTIETNTSKEFERVSEINISYSNTDLSKTYSYYSSSYYDFVQTITHKLNDSTIFTESLGYDYKGNISSINHSGIYTKINNFYYDSNNRLIEERVLNQNNTIESKIEYSYDTNGNVTSIVKTESGTTENISFAYDNNFPDKLVSFTLNPDGLSLTTSITYDSSLNPISIGTASLAWTRGRLLSEYQKGQYKAINTYNKDGIRLKKELYKKLGSLQPFLLNKTYEYLLDGNRIIAEKRTPVSANPNIVYLRYFYGVSGIEGFEYNGIVYLYLKDSLNNIVALLKYENNSFIIVAKYSYDAFGNTKVLNPDGTINTTSSFIGNINPFRYKCYYYDVDIGMYYCNSRYYYPYIRRWINADDLNYLDKDSIDGLNLFAYCKDNPVMLFDPSGNIAFWISMLIGIAVGFSISFAKDWIDDGKPFNGSVGWQEYLGSSIGGAISSLGNSLLAASIFSAIGNVTEGLISQNVNSFVDFSKLLIKGALIGALSYALSSAIKGIANHRIGKIMGESTKNIKINKRLAEAGYGFLKIGRDGIDEVYRTLYRELHYETVELVLKIIFDFGSGFMPDF